MTTPRPSFDPPATSLPSLQHYGRPGVVPAPVPTPTPPPAPVVPFVVRAPHAKRRRVVVTVIVTTIVLAIAAVVASVVSTLAAAPDLGRDTPDQPEYAAPVLPGTVPLDRANDCYDDFNADVATAMDQIEISYDGVDCPEDGEVIISLPGRYPRARLISVAEQLLTSVYDAGWDVDRVEVYDTAGTGGFYTW